METIAVIIGIVVFLGIAYICLLILVTPFIWFSTYMEHQEEKAKNSRANFKQMIEEQHLNGTAENPLISPYKPLPKGPLGKIIESQIVTATSEWLVTWGLFLVFEAILILNFFKGFELIMEKVQQFLEGVFGI